MRFDSVVSTSLRRLTPASAVCLVLLTILFAGCGQPKPPESAKPAPVARNSPDEDPTPPPSKPPVVEPEPEPAKPKGPIWPEILGASQGTLPAPREELEWLGTLSDGLERAKLEKRPILVVARCPDSKQFTALDETIQRPGGDLDLVVRQFVTVRVTSGLDLDYRLLKSKTQQDGDCSLWAWFLTEQGALLAVFGGRDHVGEETRVSAEAFESSARRVLSHYYDPRRADWKIDPPPPDLSGSFQTVKEGLPEGYAEWKDTFRKGLADVKCMRCHHLQEVALLQRASEAHFETSKDMLLWPYPENIGLKLDRDDGLKVIEVAPNSVAAKAGLAPGDMLGGANDRRLFGQADLRAVFHSLPNKGGEVTLRWMRGENYLEGPLKLPEAWREMGPEVLAWRTSLVFGPLGPTPGFFPKSLNDGQRKKLRIGPNEMAVQPVMTADSPNAKSGLQPTDIVLAVSGHKPPISEYVWIVWFRRNVPFGKLVSLDVLSTRNGSRRFQLITPVAYHPTE